MIHVTISLIGAEGHPTAESKHRASSPSEAMRKAIQKAFGKKAELHVDSATSMPDRGIWYGQPIKPNGSTVTGLVRVVTEEKAPQKGWKEKGSAGEYRVWRAGPNDYRVANSDSDVVRYFSQFSPAYNEASRLHELTS